MERPPKSKSVAEWIERLGLKPHPEGGWYRETHRSHQIVESPRHGERSAFTSILFLLEPPQVSRIHRIDAEELWNWHAGSPLKIHVFGENGERETRGLGPRPGDCFQTVVPANHWFGAELEDDHGWALVGCVVAPGFEFPLFQFGDRRRLLGEYPLHAETILRLT
ncbi:MAG TPA: cupin domain-containing protein [Fibrobacteria bacterium]|nr:cupin domain-containing protein [Fibrobacteria bacterium]